VLERINGNLRLGHCRVVGPLSPIRALPLGPRRSGRGADRRRRRPVSAARRTWSSCRSRSRAGTVSRVGARLRAIVWRMPRCRPTALGNGRTDLRRAVGRRGSGTVRRRHVGTRSGGDVPSYHGERQRQPPGRLAHVWSGVARTAGGRGTRWRGSRRPQLHWFVRRRIGGCSRCPSGGRAG
jgi:hypothetical protein